MLELVSDVLPRLRQDVRLHASFRRRLAVKLPSQDDRELVTNVIQAYEDGKLSSCFHQQVKRKHPLRVCRSWSPER